MFKFIRSQTLTTRVASYFLLLSCLTVGAVGFVAYARAKEALKQAAFNRLNVAATLKEEEITRWFEDQQRDFLLINTFPQVKADLDILLNSSTHPNPEAYRRAYETLQGYIQEISQLKPSLEEIFILNRSNKIILSSRPARVGKYEILANVTYLEEVETGKDFAPIFYVSPTTGKPAITLATSLRNKSGTRQGFILTHLNLNRIDNIIREKIGLGKTGESYLVGSLISKNTFIAKNQANINKFPEGVSSLGIDMAMSGLSGRGLYENYAGISVIGVYRWLNEQDIALLVEMRQEEAFAPARELAGTIIAVGLISAGVLLTGVYGLSRQLSISQKKLEDYSHQLELKAQEANAANLAKSEFLANMSHELRTPLNAILGFAQLMERDQTLTQQQQDSLAIINRSGEHLLNLINDVLEMSKIEAGRTTLNNEVFDLHRLLITLRDMFQVRAASKSLTLIFELSEDLPAYVVGDEGKLRQILINLLSNAFKFTDQGMVKLKAYIHHKVPQPAENLIIYFQVQDTGKGIATTEISNLFQPFMQTTAGIKSQGGTGLGLAISRQFTELMGGRIEVISKLGVGSTFSFDIKVKLVACSQVERQQEKQKVWQLVPNSPCYRILIVDDKAENRHLLATLLNDVGFTTRTATNGVEAFTIWQNWQPDLIWMDMRMPIMDGYEATKRIKLQPEGKKTKILALTATVFEEQRIEILAAGCDDIVKKPFTEEIIFRKMSQYLGVKYIYQTTKATDTPTSFISTPADNLQPKDLQVMPAEWLKALQQAAIAVDGTLIQELISQIPSTHQALKLQLEELNKNYCFEEILDLTSQP